MAMESIDLGPIGIVRNGIRRTGKLPRQGARACVEVFPEFVPGLQGVERSTHIMIIGWLHKADRGVLQVHRPRYLDADFKRGVFACRSPVRPNPLGITTVRLIKLDGNVLYVDGLDMADGTPVLDIKPHSAGFDGVFSARSARDLSRLSDPEAAHTLRSMLRDAENFHGELCQGLIVGTKMVQSAMKLFDVAQKDPGLVVCVGADGCIADAVQALTGATFGNRRLRCEVGLEFIFQFGQQRLRFRPYDGELAAVRDRADARCGRLGDSGESFLPGKRFNGAQEHGYRSLEDMLAMDIATLCEIEEER